MYTRREARHTPKDASNRIVTQTALVKNQQVAGQNKMNIRKTSKEECEMPRVERSMREWGVRVTRMVITCMKMLRNKINIFKKNNYRLFLTGFVALSRC